MRQKERAVLSLLAAVLCLVVSSGTAQGPPPAAKPATVADLAWLAGHWKGRLVGPRQLVTEQHWSEPQGGVMIGMFRLSDPAGGNRPLMLEFISFRETPEGVEMCLRHFDSGLGTDAGEPLRMLLASSDGRHFVFENRVKSAAAKRSTATRVGSDAPAAWKLPAQMARSRSSRRFGSVSAPPPVGRRSAANEFRFSTHSKKENVMSKVKPVPEGYHTVTPYLVIRNAAKAIEFYKKAFGAKDAVSMPGPGGKIMHAQIRIGDSMVMICDELPEFGAKSPQALGGSPVRIFLYVEDVDKVFNQAVSAGATVTMPVADQFWGDRFGKLVDPFGHEWNIATHKEDVAPEEMSQRAAKAMGA